MNEHIPANDELLRSVPAHELGVARLLQFEIGARVALFERMGRTVVAELDASHPGFAAVHRALDLVASWQQHPGGGGGALLEALLGEHENGVYAFVNAQNPQPTDDIFHIAGGAASLAAWHAFRLAGEPTPEGFEEDEEVLLAWLLDQACASPRLGRAAVARLIDAHSAELQPQASSPSPRPMKTLIEIEADVRALAARMAAPAAGLPTFGRTHDFGYPHIEVDTGAYHYVVVERGRESERRTTTEFDELLYWVFADVTHRLAFDFELRHRIEDQDCRRIAFPRQVELMALLGPSFAQRMRQHIDAILAQYPYDDEPTRALRRLKR